MTEAFENWWREHYSMANLAMGAASDAWEVATQAEQDRCLAAVDRVCGLSASDHDKIVFIRNRIRET